MKTEKKTFRDLLVFLKQFLFLAGDRNIFANIFAWSQESINQENFSWLSLLHNLVKDYRAAWTK